MKQDFTIPITVKAYSRKEAEAKINVLLQGSAFIKDFNVPDLAGAIITHFVWAKLGETANKIRLEKLQAAAHLKAERPVASIRFGLKPADSSMPVNSGK
ncbi:hypothetical protein [Flavisolibacter ginsenosidimutans]|uniref:Uncharacterized protein n=1 Tax=Flavisolibacter ginsenosidimutans TaxID=661481 RepID=A0A5B8UP39_9BACT|nr:hypothetical protein [Flavisolibacter ginsenosidimutans]QEC57999.1 hypothetical protein FSB75_19495 [Flavisolibacter ginsenosidimutans]